MAAVRVTRRVVLRDLGRVALGAVVVGLSACTTGDDGAAAPASTDPTGSDVPDDAPGEGGALSWERASYGFVSAYVLVRDGAALVFDAGTADGAAAPLAAALGAAGVGWSDVAHVLVSHRHGDHVGGLGAVVAEATGATVHAGEGDLQAVRGQAPAAEAVADGELLLGLRVVATPGHTPGHLSAFDEASGLLLTGDALVRDRRIGGTTGEGIEASPPDFTADRAAALASVELLAGLAPATILFGHGDPLTDDAAATLTDYADSL